ncbi:unnamed protein product [Paramecium sonneborni]|uniref:Uncharacterized protein n=1 Tax=Paramecium sonneborni TaxID=65129 RepID=A0A8S1PIW0_9CILI|nr:unnamed protein product [Paramecium sonneborni]
MKSRIKIVFQQEFNLESIIGVNNKIQQSKKPKVKNSDDEVSDEDQDFQNYDWQIDYAISSPNQKFIAFDISKQNDFEEKRFYHVAVDTSTKTIKYQKKFYDNQNMLFTSDSKYLVIDDDSGNYLVDLETFKQKKIENNDKIISIDSENNIFQIQYNFNNIEQLKVFSITDNLQSDLNIRQEILQEKIIYFEKVFSDCAFIQTQIKNYLIWLSNNKILQKNVKKYSEEEYENWIQSKFILVEKVQYKKWIFVKNLINKKLIRKSICSYDAIIFKKNKSVYKYNFSQKNNKDGDKLERTNLLTGIIIKPDLELGKYQRQYHDEVIITENYLIDIGHAKMRYFKILD